MQMTGYTQYDERWLTCHVRLSNWLVSEMNVTFICIAFGLIYYEIFEVISIHLNLIVFYSSYSNFIKILFSLNFELWPFFFHQMINKIKNVNNLKSIIYIMSMYLRGWKALMEKTKLVV